MGCLFSSNGIGHGIDDLDLISPQFIHALGGTKVVVVIKEPHSRTERTRVKEIKQPGLFGGQTFIQTSEYTEQQYKDYVRRDARAHSGWVNYMWQYADILKFKLNPNYGAETYLRKGLDQMKKYRDDIVNDLEYQIKHNPSKNLPDKRRAFLNIQKLDLQIKKSQKAIDVQQHEVMDVNDPTWKEHEKIRNRLLQRALQQQGMSQIEQEEELAKQAEFGELDLYENQRVDHMDEMLAVSNASISNSNISDEMIQAYLQGASIQESLYIPMPVAKPSKTVHFSETEVQGDVVHTTLDMSDHFIEDEDNNKQGNEFYENRYKESSQNPEQV
jgi:hypothetical protein